MAKTQPLSDECRWCGIANEGGPECCLGAARTTTTDSNAVGHHNINPVGLTDVIYDPKTGLANFIIRDK